MVNKLRPFRCLVYREYKIRSHTCKCKTEIEKSARNQRGTLCYFRNFTSTERSLKLNSEQWLEKTIKGTDELVQFPGGSSHVKGGSWDYLINVKKVNVTGLTNERGPKARYSQERCSIHRCIGYFKEFLTFISGAQELYHRALNGGNKVWTVCSYLPFVKITELQCAYLTGIFWSQSDRKDREVQRLMGGLNEIQWTITQP